MLALAGFSKSHPLLLEPVKIRCFFKILTPISGWGEGVAGGGERRWHCLIRQALSPTSIPTFLQNYNLPSDNKGLTSSERKIYPTPQYLRGMKLVSIEDFTVKKSDFLHFLLPM